MLTYFLSTEQHQEPFSLAHEHEETFCCFIQKNLPHKPRTSRHGIYVRGFSE